MEETRDTLDIETAGDTVRLNMGRDEVLGVYVRGDGAADYALDVTDDPNGTWLQGAETFGAATTVDFGGFEGAQWVRLRVTTGTATAGDTADVLLTSAGR